MNLNPSAVHFGKRYSFDNATEAKQMCSLLKSASIPMLKLPLKDTFMVLTDEGAVPHKKVFEALCKAKPDDANPLDQENNHRLNAIQQLFAFYPEGDLERLVGALTLTVNQQVRQALTEEGVLGAHRKSWW